jgi:hypothetical protein
MAYVTGVLLACYFIGVVYAVLAPSRQPDPHRGVAVGCLGMVAAGLLVLGGLLAIAVLFDVGWLLTLLFSITVYPSVALVGSSIVQRVRTGRWGR